MFGHSAICKTAPSMIIDARPSMLLDVLAGRPCEIDVINGAIPPAGREVGLQAPVNEVVTALVKAKSPLS